MSIPMHHLIDGSSVNLGFPRAIIMAVQCRMLQRDCFKYTELMEDGANLCAHLKDYRCYRK